MQPILHFLEWMLGLSRGYLSHQGLSFKFNPRWPFQETLGAGFWNVLLLAAAILVVFFAYRREGRNRPMRIFLAVVRLLLLGFVIALLNRPTLKMGEQYREPSVLAILIDDSLSMSVKDVIGPDGKPQPRLDAVIDLLSRQDGALLRRLSQDHTIHIYDFSGGRQEIATVQGPGETTPSAASGPAASRPANPTADAAVAKLSELTANGESTRIVSSLRSVLTDLQGQRLAGVVVLTDGRETPMPSDAQAVAEVKSFNVGIYPVAVGTDKPVRDTVIENVSYEAGAFANDFTAFKIAVQASGYEPNHKIDLALMRKLKDSAGKFTGVLTPVLDEKKNPITQTVTAPDGRPVSAEIQYKPTAEDIPVADLAIVAKKLDGELDDQANVRDVQLMVLDTTITVLYVDGYPRWDYRYLSRALLRDRTVKVSLWLTSADPSFHQEGSEDPNREGHTWAITGFPTSMEQLMNYDVVIFGDVDPRQFTDPQLQMVSDFVSKKGGGFAMVAGPRWSPQAFRNSPIENVLPVNISRTETYTSQETLKDPWMPVLTTEGAASSIFRLRPGTTTPPQEVLAQLDMLYWYCRNVTVKPGVGIVYAEHPSDIGPDGHKAPLFVVGRFGAGRTIFSAIDDSWRWRRYVHEADFDTYWVQQLRYLARSKKLGQRKLTFTTDQPVYELGDNVTVQVRVLAPELLRQLSPPITVEAVDASGQPVRRLDLLPQESSPELFVGTMPAEKVGQITLRLSQLTEPGGQDMTISYRVQVPRMELLQPQVDMPALARLASDTPLTLSDAADKLPVLIRSVARTKVNENPHPLWDAPLALILFTILIATEWVVRKLQGLL